MLVPNTSEWPAKPKSAFESSYKGELLISPPMVHQLCSRFTPLMAKFFVYNFTMSFVSKETKKLEAIYDNLDADYHLENDASSQLDDLSISQIEVSELSRSKGDKIAARLLKQPNEEKLKLDRRSKYMHEGEHLVERGREINVDTIPRANKRLSLLYKFVELTLILRLIVAILQFTLLATGKYSISTSKSLFKQNMLACSQDLSRKKEAGGLGDQDNDNLILHSKPSRYEKLISSSYKGKFDEFNNFNGTCAEQVTHYFKTHIGEICIWSRLEDTLSSLVTRDSFWPYSINIFEFQEPLQVFSTELLSFDGLMLLFITIISLSQFYLNHVCTTDNPGLHFIYKPGFSAYRIYCLTNHYLYILRYSYINFWIDHRITKGGRLISRHKRNHLPSQSYQPYDTTRAFFKNQQEPNNHHQQRLTSNVNSQSLLFLKHHYDNNDNTLHNHEQATKDHVHQKVGLSGDIVDSMNFNYKQFDGFLPEARTQAWRSVMSQILTAVVLATYFGILSQLITICLYYYPGIISTSKYNQKLHNALSVAPHEVPPEFMLKYWQIYKLAPVQLQKHPINRHDCFTYAEFQEALFAQLLEKLVMTDVRFIDPLTRPKGKAKPAKSKLRQANGPAVPRVVNALKMLDLLMNQTFSATTNKETPDVSIKTIRGVILESIAPIRDLKESGIWFIAFILCIVPIYIGGVISLFILLMLDIIFWLFEVSIKMNISIYILRHYSNRYKPPDRFKLRKLMLQNNELQQASGGGEQQLLQRGPLLTSWLHRFTNNPNLIVDKPPDMIKNHQQEADEASCDAKFGDHVQKSTWKLMQNSRFVILDHDQQRSRIDQQCSASPSSISDAEILNQGGNDGDDNHDNRFHLHTHLNKQHYQNHATGNNSELEHESNNNSNGKARLHLNNPPMATLASELLIDAAATKDNYYQDDGLCNVRMRDIMRYIISSHGTREAICKSYANRILRMDYSSMVLARQKTNKFLISTYLNFRLFQDEIDLCRPGVSQTGGLIFCISCSMIVCLLAVLKDSTAKYAVIAAAVVWNNLSVLIMSTFKSRCQVLPSLIYSMMSAGHGDDKFTHFLLLMWRKSLQDLVGLHSKFSFKLFGITVEPALVGEVSF